MNYRGEFRNRPALAASKLQIVEANELRAGDSSCIVSETETDIAS